MRSLSHQFLDFCRSKPADEEYKYTDPSACAFYQFAIANGIPNPVRYSSGLPALIEQVVNHDDETFGALASRLEAALGEAPNA